MTNSKERVWNALNHRGGTPVPVDFGATTVTGIHCRIVEQLRKYYGLAEKPVRIVDPFLNDKSLYEKETLEKVYHPVADANSQDPEGSTYTWYCEHNEQETTIWANFHKADPNKELVEISMRRTCFYPEKKGINYLTISGFLRSTMIIWEIHEENIRQVDRWSPCRQVK